MMTMMMICLFTCSSAISCRHSGVMMMMMMMKIMVIYLFTRSSALSWRQSGVMMTMTMTTTAR